MSFSVRRLTAEDVVAYRAIRLEALQSHPEAYGTSAEAFSARSEDALARQLTELTYHGVFSAETELSGIVAYQRQDYERERHRGRLMQVYVKPALRGTGAALAMIEATVAEAENEVVQLHLMVGTHNEPAIRLYKKAGFEIYGTDRRALHVNGRYIDEHMMVRFLDKAPGKSEHE